VPFHAATRRQSISQDEQHDVRTYTVTQEISLRENAESPHARPTLRAALHARQHRSTQPLKWRGSGTVCVSQRVQATSS
jgi:hypothetical protein